MCRSNPTVRCANHTGPVAEKCLAEYIRAWPGGAPVDPESAIRAVFDMAHVEETRPAQVPAPAPAHAVESVPSKADVRAPQPAPALESFGPVDPLNGPFPAPAGTWNHDTAGIDEIHYGTTALHRRRPGAFPDMPDVVRIEVGRPIDNEEMVRLASIVRYAQRSDLRGAEGMSGPYRDGPRSFVMEQDATKTFSDDTGMAYERFEEALPDRLATGTPVRKTSRSGPVGTRAVDGVPNLGGVSIWYDNVWVSA